MWNTWGDAGHKMLFCPKCKYTCVIRFKDGKIEEIKTPDA